MRWNGVFPEENDYGVELFKATILIYKIILIYFKLLTLH